MIPDSASTAILVVDVQEKFVPAIAGMAAMTSRLSILLAAARELSVPVFATEQYPQGLGHTVPEIASLLPAGQQPFEKTSFSCFGNEAFRIALKQSPVKNLVICGVESHVCVLQTALHAIDRGYRVFIPADCVASRKDFDRDIALDFLAKAGVRIVSAESFIFMLLRDATHPSFKAVSKLVK